MERPRCKPEKRPERTNEKMPNAQNLVIGQEIYECMVTVHHACNIYVRLLKTSMLYEYIQSLVHLETNIKENSEQDKTNTSIKTNRRRTHLELLPMPARRMRRMKMNQPNNPNVPERLCA